MLGRWIGKESTDTMVTTGEDAEQSKQEQQPHVWSVGQIVDVRARTWVGINRPGGTGRITKIHYSSCSNGIVVKSLDVKYTVSGGSDQHLSPDLVTPHQDMAPRGRRSRQKVLQLPPSSDEQDLNAATERDAENQPNESQQQREARSRSVRKPKAKKKRSPSKQQQQQPLSKLKSPTFGKSSSVKKQLKRLNALISPSQKARQQPPVFSPETAYAQNHRRRPIPSDVPSEVVFYADAGDSPESRISICTTFPSPLDDTAAPSTARTIIRSASRLEVCDTSMDVDDDLDDSEDDRKMSPTFARLMEARTMAAGQSNLSPSQLEKIPLSNKARAVHQDDDDGDSMDSSREADGAHEPRARLTLREVWDDSYKKASKFIGDVVSGADCGPSSVRKKNQSAPPTETSKDDGMDGNDAGNNSNTKRLHQFRAQLQEVLVNSDGMIEATEFSGQISDFTQEEVDEFLATLAAQNKIMHTDGWIYKI